MPDSNSRAPTPTGDAPATRDEPFCNFCGDGHSCDGRCIPVPAPAVAVPREDDEMPTPAEIERLCDAAERATVEIPSLRARIADLECRPLVLLSKREAHADALTEAQVCDRAEAERRASRRYPLPSELST